MALKYLLMVLLVVSSVSAATVYKLAPTQDYSLFVHCVQSYFDDSSDTVTVKISSDMDKDHFTSRDCLNGAYGSLKFVRPVWLKADSYSALMTNYYDFTKPEYQIDQDLNNFYAWKEVYVKTNGNELTPGQEQVKIKSSVFNNALDELNDLVYNDKTVNSLISYKDMGYYYGLATENIRHEVSSTPFYFSNGSFITDNQFIDSFNSYPVSFQANYQPGDLTNSSFLINPGSYLWGCYQDTSVFPHITGYCLQNQKYDLMTYAQNAFWGFSNSLNYYYYPFEVSNSKIKITGYINYTSLGSPVYSSSMSIPPTSNGVKIRFDKSVQGDLPEQVVLFDVPDFGTQLYKEVEKVVPATAGYIKVEVITTYKRNPLYRFSTPVDYPSNQYLIYGSDSLSDCEAFSQAGLGSGFNICSEGYFSDFGIKTTFYFNGTNPQHVYPSDFNDLDNSSVLGVGGEQNDTFDYAEVNSSSAVIVSDWNPESSGGGLESQVLFNQGLETSRIQNNLFLALQEIISVVFIILLTFWSLIVLVIVVFSFILLVPSGYFKMISEFKKLTNWRFKK